MNTCQRTLTKTASTMKTSDMRYHRGIRPHETTLLNSNKFNKYKEIENFSAPDPSNIEIPNFKLLLWIANNQTDRREKRHFIHLLEDNCITKKLKDL